MSKRANSLPEGNYPLVSVQRFQPITCDVNARQLEELAQYIRYVESAGGEKPTEGEVIGAALAELFKLDQGYARWKEGAGNTVASSKRPALQGSGANQ